MFPEGPLAAPVKITITARAHVTTVSVAGELDLAVADELERSLHVECDAAPPALIIDFRQVTLCTAAILRILVDVTTAARSHGVPCAVVSDQRAVRRPVGITGLAPSLPLLSTMAAAYDYLGLGRDLLPSN